MSRLTLFAETSRAGGRGRHRHCFLTPVGERAPQPQIAHFVRSVRRCLNVEQGGANVAFGTNFIGAGRSVEQHAGAAIRTGDEILVVPGVAGSELSEPQKEKSEALLRRLLDRLGNLVVDEIDWSRDPDALTAGRPELTEWLKELEALSLPETDWRDSPPPADPAPNPEGLPGSDPGSESNPVRPRGSTTRGPSGSSRRTWLVGILVAVAGILLMAVWHLQPSPDNGVDGGETRTPEELIRKLAKEWDCKPEDVVREMVRAADWDRRQAGDKLDLATGQNDGDVQKILGKLMPTPTSRPVPETKPGWWDQIREKPPGGKPTPVPAPPKEGERQPTPTKGVERYFVSAAVESEPEFRSFAQVGLDEQVDPKESAKSALERRRWLYEVWKKWDDLHQSPKDALDAIEKFGDKDMAQMLRKAAALEKESGLGDGFQEPKTPLFNRQDVMIWELIKKCWSTLEANDIKKFLKEQDDESPPDNGLAAFLREVGTNRDKIVGSLVESRKETTDKVRDFEDKDKKDKADAVFEAYKAFEALIKHLSKY